MAVTKKCDVYCFKVLALEVVFGDHSGDFISSMTTMKRSTHLLKTMVQQLLEKRLPSPDEDVRLLREVVGVVKTALKCVSSDPMLRPHLNEVSQELVKHPPRLTMSFRTICISASSLAHTD